MPRRRLDESNVLGLLLPKHGESPKRYWDAGTDAVRGLCVLVHPTGTRSYVVHWRYQGSTREQNKKLGRVGEMSLEEARTEALKLRSIVRKGEDPRHSNPLNSDNYKAAVELWTKDQRDAKLRTSADLTCTFLLARTRRWHDRPVATIQPAEIAQLLLDVRDGTKKRRGAPYSAIRLHAHFKTFFLWCAKKRLIAENPAQYIDTPWTGAKRRERAWFSGEQADEAIAKLWRCADELGGKRGRFLKLTLCTGKRRAIVETMRWEHIDRAWVWTPPKGSKSKRNHAIPLPKLAQQLLGERKLSGRVIPPICPVTLANNVRKMTGIDDFLFHGIRHIVESKLAELRVSSDLRDLLLDHAPRRGAGAGYDHHNYMDEMREALTLWSAHIERVTKADAAPAWRTNLRHRAQRLQNVA